MSSFCKEEASPGWSANRNTGRCKKEMSPNCPANVALILTALLDGLAQSRTLLLHLDYRELSFQFVPFVMGQSTCYPMYSRTISTENTVSQIKQYQESKDVFKPAEKTPLWDIFLNHVFPPFCLFLFLRQGYYFVALAGWELTMVSN